MSKVGRIVRFDFFSIFQTNLDNGIFIHFLVFVVCNEMFCSRGEVLVMDLVVDG